MHSNLSQVSSLGTSPPVATHLAKNTAVLTLTKGTEMTSKPKNAGTQFPCNDKNGFILLLSQQVYM